MDKTRYVRQLELDDFDEKDLEKLSKKKVLIIGMGGLGQPIALYLLAAGVIHLGLVDKDQCETTNLNRQILVIEKALGMKKVDVVKKELLLRNKEADIQAFTVFINDKNINEISKGYDVIIDATDNWESKLVINDFCHKHKLPLLHVGVLGYQGQFLLLPNDKNISLRNIIDKEILKQPFDGIIGAMVGIIASMATMSLIKFLLGNHCFDNQLIAYDFKKQSLKKLNFN